MSLLRFAALFLVVSALAGCGSDDATDADAGATSSGSATATGAAGGNGSGGGSGDACGLYVDDDIVRLAVGTTVDPGKDETVCLRYTTPDDIDVSSLIGTLGDYGHHALLLAHASATEPDGTAPCSDPEIMDASLDGDFQLLAGVSYESDGQRIDFPATPVQVGLHVPAGSQLILDGHFLNTTGKSGEGCASIELSRGKPVVAKLQFRTVLPEAEYDLAIAAHDTKDVTYEQAAGGKFRIAAASSHMHAGGTHFRMSIKETGKTLYETMNWADPTPATFQNEKIVVDETQTFELECSFENNGETDQHFPTQMCVGGMYVLPCTLPGAC